MSLPRWALNAQASTLRGTINFAQNYLSAPIYGYYAHTPFAHSYTLTIPAKTSSIPGTINLIVYTPPSHSSPPSKEPQSSESSSASNSASKKKPLPCVLNFHGGGFVIGVGIDDERWARACVEQLNAVVVSVEYRLAPQHVFPTAVQDSVDAYLYIQEHAKDLGIDVDNIVTSGFSSEGSLAFTVPLMLFNMMREGMGKGEANNQEMGKGVKAVVSFYPATDSTRSREVRASSMALPEKKLPVWLTNIFDDSYRYCAEGNLDLTSPYLSPGLAPAELIEKAIPKDILVYTCEHDMLCFEGKIFAERLKKEGKNVVYKCVEGVPHAWDKGPNPLPKPEPIYAEACEHLKRVLRIESQAIEES